MEPEVSLPHSQAPATCPYPQPAMLFTFMYFDSEKTYFVAFNPLQTKRRLLYLKTQSVPRCKNFSSRL
jgi:hypothetical protein